MRKLNEAANERYLSGSAINNPELKSLYQFYDETAALLAQLGPVYHLAFKEANAHAIRLGDYGRSRGMDL